MAGQTFYITTTIPYVNARPHAGHALEFVQTDTFTRYHRLRGEDVYALTGSDENALKNVQAAEREGITARELVDRNSLRFQELGRRLEFGFDQFIRTAADPRHRAGAEKIWRAVVAAGDIYTREYSGLYCVGCELYYDEGELVDGLCPEHGTRPDLIEEENYFFRLSRYGEQLHDLISSDRLRIIPNTRKNEVLSFITRGLEDFSVSRSQERARGWGIPVPDDPSQVIYVWFDALTNYITALDYADEGELFRRYWCDNPVRVHALGKGVIRFHAIYWPAMLLSAGLPLPTLEFVHGYINVEGTKMSKSLGNVVDPEELVDRYGAEAVRYYFLRGVPATGDTNFSIAAFEARYNADLANDLGNLLNRTLSMISRYRGGTVPEPGQSTELEVAVEARGCELSTAVCSALDAYDPQAALEAVWGLISHMNRYAETSAPWNLAKAAKGGDAEADTRLSTALYTLAESVRLVGAAIEPLLPQTSVRITEQLGISPEGEWSARLAWGTSSPGTRVSPAGPLFPRLETVQSA